MILFWGQRRFSYKFVNIMAKKMAFANGFEKSKHLVNKSYSSDTLQSLKHQNIDRKL